MGIYNNDTKIARIYNGATAEISTVRRAVSANFGQTVHEAEKPFTVHRWLVNTGPGASLAVPSFNNFLLICKAEKTELTSHPRILSQNINNGVVIQTENDAINYYVNAAMQGQVKVSDLNYIKIQQRDGVVYLNDELIDKWTALKNISEIMLRGMDNVPPHGIGIHKLNTDSLILIPALLSRPTFPTEDYNGIARKKNEAVLVDEERFRRGLSFIFGNIADLGNFNVSDYLIEGEDYERIEGVVIIVNRETYPHLTLDWALSDSNPVVITAEVFSGWYNGGRAVAQMISGTNTALIEYTNGGIRVYENQDSQFFIPTGIGRCSAEFYKSRYVFNGNTREYSISYNKIRYLLYPYLTNLETTASKVVVYSFTQSNVINLIPVRLKRDIEPHCTHNGKGGTAGEICFFDTVSGKAFTNDGTGAFTEYIPETT